MKLIHTSAIRAKGAVVSGFAMPGIRLARGTLLTELNNYGKKVMVPTPKTLNESLRNGYREWPLTWDKQ